MVRDTRGRWQLAGLTMAILGSVVGAPPLQAQGCTEIPAPYIFILLDTSGAMSYAPACSQEEADIGLCDKVCDQACWTQLHGDDPASRLYIVKQALYEALADPSNNWNGHFGFATYNQDRLKVGAKHWLYRAAGDGVSIPGWGAFPAAGAQEVFGRTWRCDTGTGDNEIGCHADTPADLSDAWERARVQQLPKAGKSGHEEVEIFVRSSGVVYKVRYEPAHDTVLGMPATVTETVWRCGNAHCGDADQIGQASLHFDPVSEFLAWDSPGGAAPNRNDPMLSYFPAGATDADAANTCSGWEPNDDSAADKARGYNLHWPTTPDPRGPLFSLGDVIPPDWHTHHQSDILLRLAPNLNIDPTAEPDFRTSSYFEDDAEGDSALHLKDPGARPLIAAGSAPLGNALRDFRLWYTGCLESVCPPGSGWVQTAQAQDPYFACRRKFLLVITGSGDTCGGQDACNALGHLRSFGVLPFVVSVGVTPAPPLTCALELDVTHSELNLRATLTRVFDEMMNVIGSVDPPAGAATSPPR